MIIWKIRPNSGEFLIIVYNLDSINGKSSQSIDNAAFTC